MGYKTAATVILALLVAGCEKGNIKLPKLELPKKPLSTDIPCDDLTELEQQACLQEGEGARKVCKKVQRNKLICSDQQDFVDRLYKERDGK
ncbi:MAG: hypothetical protein AAGC70_01865 [Pseudomonadota bacterium]